MFCGKFFSMKLRSIADCYIHYGKLGKDIIGIGAKKHLNVLIIKVSFIILKENKTDFFKIAYCSNMQYIFFYCSKM